MIFENSKSQLALLLFHLLPAVACCACSGFGGGGRDHGCAATGRLPSPYQENWHQNLAACGVLIGRARIFCCPIRQIAELERHQPLPRDNGEQRARQHVYIGGEPVRRRPYACCGR